MEWLEGVSVAIALISAAVSVYFALQSKWHEQRIVVAERRSEIRQWAAKAMSP